MPRVEDNLIKLVCLMLVLRYFDVSVFLEAA